MLYFRTADLAKTYLVTPRTVRNWIEAAKHGKLALTLHHENDKAYVANTSGNVTLIKHLVEEGRKYRNTKAVKTISPRPEFYQLYTHAQIHDIVTNIEIHHEVPREYNYFDGGAGNWDRYAHRLATEATPNLLTRTIQLLADNRGYLDKLLAPYQCVNVVDVGVGNALPVRELLAHLLDQGVLGRYIALDISPEMLTIAEHNIKEWFGGRVAYEGHELDINYDRFSHLLAEEYTRKDANDTVNLVLLLGGTLSNLRQPDGAFRLIHDSMGRKDLLVYGDKLDTEASRRYFDFNPEPGTTTLAPNHRFIFDLLNIDESFYDVEMGFDERRRQRYIRVRLKVSLTLTFQFAGGGSRTLELNKGETILLWRAWEVTALDIAHQFDRNDFYTLHASQTEDEEYILTVSRVKCE